MIDDSSNNNAIIKITSDKLIRYSNNLVRRTIENIENKTCIDVEGNSYKTVKIGDQIWMAENLNVSLFRNGDSIPEARTDAGWRKAGKEGTPAWCYYDNKSENGNKYGRLYNWYAVNDKRGLAPEGWHIPTIEELQILNDAVDNNSNSLIEIGQGNNEPVELRVLRAILGETSQETNKGVGTNKSGFSALLAGYRAEEGDFSVLGGFTDFWSSTVIKKRIRTMSLHESNNKIYHYAYNKWRACYVRCIKD